MIYPVFKEEKEGRILLQDLPLHHLQKNEYGFLKPRS